MNKTIAVKEKIIESAIALIQNSNGNTSEITTRDIAERAKVGNGLINYHFQTKENLIDICVQHIISNVLDGFNPNVANIKNINERIVYAASEVFEFFFENPAISRISILSPSSNTGENSNAVKSQKSIFNILGEDIDEKYKRIFSFVLTSTMQVSFICSKYGDIMLGYKLDTPDSRKAFIKDLVDMLLYGANTEENIRMVKTDE